MKKYILSIFALAAAISCSKMGSETVQQPNTPSEKIPGIEYEKLVVNTGSETKTSLNGTSCEWNENDSFNVFADKVGYASSTAFSLTSGDSFEGEVPVGTEDFYAVYGSATGASGSNSSFTASVTIPTTQKAVLGSFDPAAHIAVAHGTRTPGSTDPVDVTFTTFNRLIKITVPVNVTSVVFSSNTAIAGTMTMNCSSDGTLSMNSNASANSVTLTNGDGTIEAGTYYLCVAPVNMEGFQMVYTFTDGSTYTKSSAKTLEMAASNQIRNLTLTIPMPSVSTSGFYSTYDYAESNILDTANNPMNRFRLLEGKVSANETEGWDGIKYGYQIDGRITKNLSSGENITAEVEGIGLKTISGKIFCGGTEITSESFDRNITGLPFIDNQIVSSNFSGWSTMNAEIKNGGIALSGKSSVSNCGYAISSPFYVPGTIGITVTVNANSSAGLASSYSNIYIGCTDDMSKPSTDEKISINNRVAEKKVELSLTPEMTSVSFRAAMIAGLTQTISSVKIEYR